MKKLLLPSVLVLGFPLAVQADDEVTSLFDLSLEELTQITIHSSSGRDERVQFIPGVISVITREEITSRGYRKLSDALLSIPGFSEIQNDDEYLYAPRGIYSSTNQKLLIMRDGHVVNESNLDIVHLDYAYSLEAIDRIEVIRGPGASIYGNAAMGAVVNIITREGSFKSTRVRAGNNGQKDVDFAYGIKEPNYAVTLFGRYSDTHGDSFIIPAEQDNDTQPPSDGVFTAGNFPNNYDAGLKGHYGNWHLLASDRRDALNMHWRNGGQNTDPSLLLGQPQFKVDSTHFELAYKRPLSEKLTVNLKHYYDDFDIFIIKNIGEISTEEPNGIVKEDGWQTDKLGLHYILDYVHSDALQINGGITYEKRRYTGSHTEVRSASSTETGELFEVGEDNRHAVHLELDWTLNPKWKINLGGRYDGFSDYSSTFVPRLALNYVANDNWSGKLIYTDAFQAPGYSYQNSNVNDSGSLTKLSPEELSSLQFVARYDNDERSAYVEATLFENTLDNMIVRSEGFRVNSGQFYTYGFELEGRLKRDFYELHGYYSLILPDESKIDALTLEQKVRDDEFKHLSTHTLFLDAIFKLTEKTHLSTTARWGSSFYDKNNEKVPGNWVVNSTLSTQLFSPRSRVSLSIYNLFDEKYELGDEFLAPIPQQGRSFLVGIHWEL